MNCESLGICCSYLSGWIERYACMKAATPGQLSYGYTTDFYSNRGNPITNDGQLLDRSRVFLATPDYIYKIRKCCTIDANGFFSTAAH